MINDDENEVNEHKNYHHNNENINDLEDIPNELLFQISDEFKDDDEERNNLIITDEPQQIEYHKSSQL